MFVILFSTPAGMGSPQPCGRTEIRSPHFSIPGAVPSVHLSILSCPSILILDAHRWPLDMGEAPSNLGTRNQEPIHAHSYGLAPVDL